MDIDWNVLATIASPIIALVAGVFLNRLVENRPRLITYLGHVSAHRLKQSDGSFYNVHTHSIVLRNSGRKSATNVRLSHSILPDFSAYPDIEHHVETLPGGAKEIVIPALVPSEQITISYLYFPPTTWNQINGLVKSDEGLAKILHVLPTQQYPAWFNRLVLILMLIGTIAVAYIIFEGTRRLL